MKTRIRILALALFLLALSALPPLLLGYTITDPFYLSMIATIIVIGTVAAFQLLEKPKEGEDDFD
mgnify:FL=1